MSSILGLNTGKTATTPRNLVWWPQEGPQSALFYCTWQELLYGGARGGGKTDGVLGKWGWKAQRYGAGFNAIIFRPTMPSQDDIWERAREIYSQVGADFSEHVRLVRFPSGGRIRFRPLERVSDADKYQGQNLSDVWVEEIGLYPDPSPVDRLWGAIRSGAGTPAQMIVTGNPGGAGQFWVKERYIDPWPAGNRPLLKILPNGAQHIYGFIPSKVTDNKILLQRDPGYVNRLYMVGQPALVKAWLDGDWNAVEGAYFDCWNPNKHIIRPFPIPKSWTRYCSMDWGSAKPFSIGWHAIVEDDMTTAEGVKLPRGCAIRYREWYGRGDRYNTGLKLTIEQVAAGIKEREEWHDTQKQEKIKLRVADPQIFATDGGPSHAERFSKCGIHFAPADNTRLPERGRMVGWDLVRARLIGEHGNPMLVVFSSCSDLIRTLPVAQHDDKKPEDIDTDSEDHALDEERYFCAARPYIPPELKELVRRRPRDGYSPQRERSWREY